LAEALTSTPRDIIETRTSGVDAHYRAGYPVRGGESEAKRKTKIRHGPVLASGVRQFVVIKMSPKTMLDPALEIRCEDKWLHQNIREKIEKRVCEWLNAVRQTAPTTYLLRRRFHENTTYF
jgi:hypothetical protein